MHSSFYGVHMHTGDRVPFILRGIRHFLEVSDYMGGRVYFVFCFFSLFHFTVPTRRWKEIGDQTSVPT
jgi:hypothetical protein